MPVWYGPNYNLHCYLTLQLQTNNAALLTDISCDDIVNWSNTVNFAQLMNHKLELKCLTFSPSFVCYLGSTCLCCFIIEFRFNKMVQFHFNSEVHFVSHYYQENYCLLNKLVDKRNMYLMKNVFVVKLTWLWNKSRFCFSFGCASW